MPFIVPLGNRQGGPPSINLSEKPKVVSLECCCRSFPKLIELILAFMCVAFTSMCAPSIVINERNSSTANSIYTQDGTRSYLAFVSTSICILIIFGVCFGYCIEGVKKMLKHETMLLVLCGGLCIVSGGLVLDATINHGPSLTHCKSEDRPFGITGGSLFIFLGLFFFLDAFIAYKTQPPVTQTLLTSQPSVKTKHLPAKSANVVYAVSREKCKMDFAEATEN